MQDSTLIESLLYQSGGTAIDFKSEQYIFSNGIDEQKSELLKDVLAFANAWRETDAYIVIGVEEVTGGRHNPVNITDHPDDAQLQQFINSKTNRRIEFSYEVHNYEGNKIGIIKIAKQERPVYPKKDYGKVKRNIVYFRLGSATETATPDDIARMGREVIPTLEFPNMVLQFADNKNRQELGENINLRSVAYAKPLQPINIEKIYYFYLERIGFKDVDKNYLREKEESIRIGKLCQPISLVIQNQSSILAEQVKVEIKGSFLGGIQVTDELPHKPAYKRFDIYHSRLNLRSIHSKVKVKNYGNHWSLSVCFGDVQPKSTMWIDEHFYLGSMSMEHLELEAVIFANNLSEPQSVKLSVDFTIIKKETLTVKDLDKIYLK